MVTRFKELFPFQKSEKRLNIDFFDALSDNRSRIDYSVTNIFLISCDSLNTNVGISISFHDVVNIYQNVHIVAKKRFVINII